MLAKSKTTIFLHIPKTAGTTLNHIIVRQYPAANTHAFGIDAAHSIAAFKALPAAEKSKIALLRGHMPFGLHADFPHPTAYFTLLREPVARVISYYGHILRSPDHYLYDFVTQNNLSLKALLESKRALLLNDGQVRFLSGVWGDVEFGDCDEKMLEAAKKNLREHFAVVGLTERFDATLVLLKQTFGWDNIYYERHNVGQYAPKQHLADRATVDAIMASNRLDIELYSYAQKLLQTQLAKKDINLLTIQQFKLKNWAHHHYRKLRHFSVRAYLRDLASRNKT